MFRSLLGFTLCCLGFHQWVRIQAYTCKCARCGEVEVDWIIR
jgi:hypothetical protein